MKIERRIGEYNIHTLGNMQPGQIFFIMLDKGPSTLIYMKVSNQKLFRAPVIGAIPIVEIESGDLTWGHPTDSVMPLAGHVIVTGRMA